MEIFFWGYFLSIAFETYEEYFKDTRNPFFPYNVQENLKKNNL